jgi:hypothetical protein
MYVVRHDFFFAWLSDKREKRKKNPIFVTKNLQRIVQTEQPMSKLQLELLKLYATGISDQQLEKVKKLLADFFAEMIDVEMNEVWEKQGWNEQTIEQWKTERMRMPYKVK